MTFDDYRQMEAVLRDQLDRVNRHVERLARLGTPPTNPEWAEAMAAHRRHTDSLDRLLDRLEQDQQR